MLDLLGLDTISETVYRIMLTDPRAELAEVAAAADLSVAQVRGALDRLAELSLIRPSWEDSGQIRPVSPEIGLEVLLARQQAELAAHQRRIETSRVAALQLIAEHAESRPHEPTAGVEQLVGLDRIRDRLTDLSRQVEREVCAFVPGQGLSEDNIAAARPLDEQLLGRGVGMRIVVLDAMRNHAGTMAYVRDLVELGAQVRTAGALPVRMTLIDQRLAVIPVDPECSGAAAVVLEGLGAVKALHALFDQVWREASPVGPKRPCNAQGLTGQEMETLRMLVAGHTDQVIAKRLGVSVRTAGRLASDLMRRLSADSRFQAGYELAQTGWLDHMGR
ncbi:helix-turn-helix transcriptional regulator [Kitasatospora sp. MBT63]|uniref:helix-turn-helix domain-containing protein n=1 Tax=Kitasatospora sp. MBT63 TaxID=1444768 RepID=UPI00053AE167|nr:helix-turn-helix transcriptional regulator [Kitasatospora sp. MBT63]